MIVDAIVWLWERLFGADFSNQIKSIMEDARFWLINRFLCGSDRWTVVGK